MLTLCGMEYTWANLTLFIVLHLVKLWYENEQLIYALDDLQLVSV